MLYRMVALVLDGLVGFPAGLSLTSLHLSPSSFHLSPRLGACGRVPGWLVSHFLSFVSHFFSFVSHFLSFVSHFFSFVSQFFSFVPGRVPGWPVSHFLSFVSHFFSLVSQFFSFVSQAGCLRSGSRLSCLPLPFICLLFFPALDCCVRLCLAILSFVSQLWAAVSASALQSLTLHVSPSSDCCVRLCLAILYMCPRKPLHLSPCRLQSFTFVSLCLHLSPSSGQLFHRLETTPIL